MTDSSPMSGASLKRWPLRLATAAGCLVFLTGAIGLCGWSFGMATLKDVLPGWPLMAAITALSFVLSGAALCLASVRPSDTAAQVTRSRGSVNLYLSEFFAAIVTLLSLLKLGGYIMGWNIAIDRLWFRELAGPANPGRMAPATAAGFVLLGGALMLVRNRRLPVTFQLLTIAGGSIGWLGFSHYLYGGAPLVPYGQMAIHTAGAIFVLSGGVLCSRTDCGLMAMVISDSSGGVITRRLMPVALLVPVVFGWLCLKGQLAGLFGTEAGTALFALANVLMFGGLIWANASQLHNSDEVRRRAEDRIRGMNEDLERHVAERTAELKSTNEELGKFTYSIAHDLRAPLRAIAGYSAILKENYQDRKLDDVGNRHLGVIQGEAQRLGRLIDDLLSFTRLGRQTLKSSRIDMTALARAAFEAFAVERDQRMPVFDLKPLPPARGDPDWIRQVFAHLLSNAIKFTRRQKPAIIEVGAQSDGEQNTYYVRDNGVGFDPKYSNRLFGIFQRLHRDDEFEGTGVGLALVKRIIQRHEGKVWAAGKPGHGATFYFTLPKEAAKSQETQT